MPRRSVAQLPDDPPHQNGSGTIQSLPPRPLAAGITCPAQAHPARQPGEPAEAGHAT